MPSPHGAPVVAVRGLTKRFGQKTAVDGVALDVPRGSVFGLIGPNGAGKTTTLRMVTALLRPDAGVVHVDGVDVWADPVAAKRRFGVLPDDLHLFERLTGAEMLTYIGRLRRLPAEDVRTRVRELLVVLGLEGDASTLVADYSQGMRKKIALAAAVLHGPRVLFLDEPFESVDPVSARTINDVIERFCSGGGTVVFSTHVLDVVERLCSAVALIDQGRVVVHGPMDEVRRGERLEDVFVRLVGRRDLGTDSLGWLAAGAPDGLAGGDRDVPPPPPGPVAANGPGPAPQAAGVPRPPPPLPAWSPPDADGRDGDA
ncbi:MAG: ABC transporter ATP-binding protein [Actinomycetota bacterium]|nr:ABC transporter ATP-binding protein [Actinomycetota bacterium]